MIFEYGLSLVYLNIVIYLYLNFTLFTILFTFNTIYFKTLNDFKNIGNIPFFSITFIIVIFSLAGVPPTLGFITKSLLFLYLFFKKSFLFLTVLTFLNFFIMYFYIRTIRYTVSKSYTLYFIFDKNYSFLN